MKTLKAWWAWSMAGPAWRKWLGFGGPILALLLVIAIASGGSAKDETAAAPVTQMESPQPPTAVPPEPPFEERAAKSYRDNRGFMLRASADGLKVTWTAQGGILIIDLTPKAILSEGDSLTIAGASAIVASRAVWTTYPEVQEITVSIWTSFTDQVGASSQEIAAGTTVRRPTGDRFQYDGLRDRALGDNKLFFCAADRYQIHPAVYRELKDKGCLAQWGSRKA